MYVFVIIYQILASQVYFWDHEEDELELMHSRKMYPPRFTLQVHGQSATHDAVAQVEFKGGCMELSTEIYLGLPTTGTLRSLLSFSYLTILSRYHSY